MIAYYARRLGALFYDGLLLIAFWLLFTFVLVLLSGGTLISPHANELQKVLYTVFLLALAWMFFCWFWTHGGQTLGMRAWKLQLQPVAGTTAARTVSWRMANRRFFVTLAIWAIGSVSIPVVWASSPQHSSLSERLTLALVAWIATSWLISTAPWTGKRGLADRLSGTRVAVLS